MGRQESPKARGCLVLQKAGGARKSWWCSEILRGLGGEPPSRDSVPGGTSASIESSKNGGGGVTPNAEGA